PVGRPALRSLRGLDLRRPFHRRSPRRITVADHHALTLFTTPATPDLDAARCPTACEASRGTRDCGGSRGTRYCSRCGRSSREAPSNLALPQLPRASWGNLPP